MEKKTVSLTSVLMDLYLGAILRDALRETRRVAQEVEVFRTSRNGCVRFTVTPLTEEADIWLGPGHADGVADVFDLGDICKREFVYPIFPRGSHTIEWKGDDGHIEPVNCYGYSALKTAFRSKFDRSENSPTPENPGFYVEDNGWSAEHGSVRSQVCYAGKPVMWFYVCVSGATAEEDEHCALAGLSIINRILTACGFTVESDA